MTTTTTTRQEDRTATYAAVEMALRAQHPDQPDLTLEGWVKAQRKLGVAWRPMAPKLHDAARLDLLPPKLRVGYEALRRWFPDLDDNAEAESDIT